MIIHRWQAPIVPTKEQVKQFFRHEGLQPVEEFLEENSAVENFKSPFNEVRMVVEGELLVTVSGTQLLLRPGDKIRIPANTTQSKKVSGGKSCVCVYAYTAL